MNNLSNFSASLALAQTCTRSTGRQPAPAQARQTPYLELLSAVLRRPIGDVTKELAARLRSERPIPSNH